jgi:hypothetical protein
MPHRACCDSVYWYALLVRHSMASQLDIFVRKEA